MNPNIKNTKTIKRGKDNMNEFIVISIKPDGARVCSNIKTGETVVFDKDCGIDEKVGEKFEIEIQEN